MFFKNRLLNKEFNDFLFYPFNVSKPMASTALTTMKKACEILKSLNIQYCLADGTLLGVYRDNRLIPHDTDVDISVVHPVDARKIEKSLKENGFRLGRKVITFGKVQQLSFYTNNEDLFDILFYTIIGKNAYCFSEKDFYIKHDAEHYKILIPRNFDGYTFYIPHKTDKWLEHVYGENWKTPKSSKPKNWREGGVEYLAAVPFDGNFKKLIKEIENRKVT